MMTNPPIDKLIKKASCRYELVAAVTARAKQLLKQDGDIVNDPTYKPLSIAAKEIYNDEVLIVRHDNSINNMKN